MSATTTDPDHAGDGFVPPAGGETASPLLKAMGYLAMLGAALLVVLLIIVAFARS